MTSVETTGATRRPSIWILVAVSAINPLAMNIFVPSMPGLIEYFDTDIATVQLTLSLYLAAIAAVQLLIGPLSDRYGRRPVLLWGLVIFIIATIACRFAPTIETLIIARAAQGAGGCTGIVLGRAIVRDLFDRNKSASMIGYVTMGMAVAPMVGPAIGGSLDRFYGWQTSFDFLLVLGVIVTVAAWYLLHETNRGRGRAFSGREFIGAHLELMKVPAFWFYALTGAAASVVFFAFLGGASHVSTRLLGLGPQAFGAYFIIVAGGYIVGNFLSGRFAARIGPDRMILLGNVLAIVAILSMAALFGAGLYHPFSLFGPVFFTSMANGISLPSSISSAISIRPDRAGAASGITATLQVGIGAIGTYAVGNLIDQTVWPLILVMGCGAVAALVCGIAARAATPAALR